MDSISLVTKSLGAVGEAQSTANIKNKEHKDTGAMALNNTDSTAPDSQETTAATSPD